MKESISYSFLLNIIILFIFVCAAIVGGIFSYYKAFRANTIIINEIEKYEGYNCIAESKIASKLKSISYNLPFNVNCKDNEKNCTTDELNNYKVYFYYVDHFSITGTDYDDTANDSDFDAAIVRCSDDNNCEMLYTYQYGVYTYMYTDLPIVSGLLRIPVFSKTAYLHDFRNLTSDGKRFVYDANTIPSDVIDYMNSNDKDYSDAVSIYANLISTNSDLKKNGDSYGFGIDYFGYGRKKIINYSDVNLRDDFISSDADSGNASSLRKNGKKQCGYVPDWSIF